MKKRIAIYPYKPNQSSYMGMITGFLQAKYNVVDYLKVKQGIYDIEDIDVIYLNWLEGSLDDEDIYLLKQAKAQGINIIWVFHNRIAHDAADENQAIKRAGFLVNVSTHIIIHSKMSIRYLKEFVPDMNEKKVHYIPHPDFVGDYYSFGNIREKYQFSEEEIVFSTIGWISQYKNLEVLIEAFKGFQNGKCRLIIAGNANDREYVNMLSKLIADDERIILDAHYISSMQMESYLKASDILVLPYSKKSSMNSGVMLMSFSYKKTVIVPDITMAEDFDDSLFYKYHYASREEHVEVLRKMMQKAYGAGREKLKFQGQQLYNEVKGSCSKEIVKNELYKLIGENPSENSEMSRLMEMEDKLDAASYRAAITMQWLMFKRNNRMLVDFLAWNGFKTIAVYGYAKTGRFLVEELALEGVSVSYVIDRNADKISDIKAYTLDECLPEVDLIIITANGQNCIKEQLRQKGFKNAVALLDILELN